MSKLILVVDDEDDIRFFVKGSLEMEGYEVIDALNGDEALAKLEKSEKEVDLIITDVRMPEKSGFELLKDVRHKNPDVPFVIVITGHTDIDEEEFVKEGAQAFLRKPFKLNELLSSIETILGPQ